MTAEPAPIGAAPGRQPHRIAATGQLLVEARGVAIRLGGQQVLSDVDLAVHQNEIVTIIGPNGSGKSTLLKVVLGLLRPDSGRVWVRQGLRIGYMPQRLVVDRTLPITVARFLSLGGGDLDGIEQALEEVGAGNVASSPIQEISGGELQRVLLARALLRRPDLLVLDEPVQSVDVAGQAEIYALIGRIRDERHCGVLMVSHDLHVVMSATNTVICLNHHVCCTGHPEAVSRDPAYLALFGPEVAASLATYAHHHDHVHSPSGTVLPSDEDEDDG